MTRIPILCYHKVGPASTEGRFINVEPATLGAHVAFFKRRGYEFVLARDLMGVWPSRAVCLTFDDAYQSLFENGTPVLQRHDVTATVYAVSDHVGGTSAWDGNLARPIMDFEALRRMEAMGFEVGNHTATHPCLSRLSPEEAQREVRSAHERLTHEGLNLATFCYPYGDLGPAAREAVAGAGYGVGLALGKQIARDTDPRLALPRIVVAYSDRLPKFWYRIFVRPKLREFSPFRPWH